MGNHKIRPLVPFFILAGLGVFSLGAEWTSMETPLTHRGFQKIETKNDVTVYQHPRKDVARIAAEGVFSFPPERVQQVLLDYPGQLGQIGRISEAHVLESKSGQILVYQRIRMPVISDRDYNLLVKWGQTGDLRWIRFRAVSDAGRGIQRRVVRVVDHVGSWQLRPIKGGTATLARFQFRIDLGGGVPSWMVRSGAGDDISQLFVEFRKMLEGP